MGLVLGLSLGLGIPGALIIGLFIGFKVATKIFKKQLKDNPPINRQQIIAMYSQMGRRPSEQQINQILSQFKKQSN
jgi:uncharacterized protein YneF (UPF0154 family)